MPNMSFSSLVKTLLASVGALPTHLCDCQGPGLAACSDQGSDLLLLLQTSPQPTTNAKHRERRARLQGFMPSSAP